MKNQNNKTICVIGLGYVGLPLALLAHSKGYRVIGIDTDERKVNLINRKRSPFFDEAINRQLKEATIKATTDFSTLKDSSIIVICVPTPVYENYEPNLEPVENACKSIAPHLQKGQLVVLESTVNPGVSETVVLPLLEQGSGLKCGVDFYLAHCPERINPGDKKWNVENINRVVGAFGTAALKKSTAFYTSIIAGEVKPMGSLKEAEAVKVVENSFRDINIAFVNELAMSFSRLGIDLVKVIEGAATKPFSFMPHFPGCGVGGHCIPVDPYYLIDYASRNGFSHDFLKLARQINNHMPAFTAEVAKQALSERNIPIKGANVTVLGLAYKPEIADDRESPSYDLIHCLEELGANVTSFDPFIVEKSTVKTLEEGLENADAIIVATAHTAFKKLTPNQVLQNGVKAVIDGRNCLLKEKFIEAGVTYRGIGR